MSNAVTLGIVSTIEIRPPSMFMCYFRLWESVNTNVGREWEKGAGKRKVFAKVMLVGPKVIFQAVFTNQAL